MAVRIAQRLKGVGGPHHGVRTRALSNLVPTLSTNFPAPVTLPYGENHMAEVTVGNTTLTYETGKLARLADGAAVVKLGDTHVMASACSQRQMGEGQDFMPLQVEYRERLSAIGRIPNTFNRREGSPKDHEILTARVIDRAVRPLFPKGYFYETQLIHNVLCSDRSMETDMVCINAASTALTVSDIPWGGPVGAVRVAMIGGDLVLFPSASQNEEADLVLLYACTADAALMMEAAGARGGVSEEAMASAFRFAHANAVQLIPPQIKLAELLKRPKRAVRLAHPSAALLADVREKLTPLTEHILTQPLCKNQRESSLGLSRRQVSDVVNAEAAAAGVTVDQSELLEALDAVEGEAVRRQILSGTRCDGRGLHQLRDLYAEVGLLGPSVHGSSLFNRGDTQALATVSIASGDEAQRLDQLVGPDRKRFFLHYGFPPYSVNECGKVGGASRREIGHGALAEKALAGVLPDAADFPFSLRVTSETMGSNGSSSMAAVCSGSLALMDAGVPLRAHVAGISVGLILGETAAEAPTLFTDIQGLEDHHGDMDFKVAGTREGITAIQLDIKPAGVPLDVLIEALMPARAGRLQLLDKFDTVLPAPRDTLSETAPRYGTIKLEKDVVGKVIGKGGESVKALEKATECRLTVDSETHECHIFAPNTAAFELAMTRINETIQSAVSVGSKYRGKVVSIKDFGAIVELEGSGVLGLLHISEIEHMRTNNVADVLQVEQELEVMCTGRDPRGNVKFSRKALLPPPPPSSGDRSRRDNNRR